MIAGTLHSVDGVWQQLAPGQSVKVPPGTPHAEESSCDRSPTKPALEFEPFFRKLQALVVNDRMSLPPKNFQSLGLVSMLFVAHENEIRSANPPQK